MNITHLTCNICGGDLKIESRFIKTIVCRYCNTVYLLENDTINNVGVSKPFRPLSIFKVGAIGKIENQSLQVLGRIRLQDDEDIWDEWYVLLNNRPFWIEESSDVVQLLSSIELTNPIGKFSDIYVGQIITINTANVFISEKGEAKIIGIEGAFTGRVKPNDEYKFIQGNAENNVYMIEYYENEIKTFKGRRINVDTVSIEQ